MFAHAEFSGLLSVESASTRKGLSKNEVLVEPRWDVAVSQDMWLTVKGRARFDLNDEIEQGKVENETRSRLSRRYAIGSHGDLELREAYLDFELGSAQMRIGKQQVVWGQADGLRVLDVINPLSYREFILGDFEDRRIPLWMINTEVPIGNFVVQGLIIPDQTYDDLPSTGSSFRFKALETAKIQYERPSHKLTDADVGLKLSSFVDGWDFSLNYLRHFRDEPRLEFKLEQLSEGQPAEGQALKRHLTGRYYRSTLVGAAASKAFGDGVVRLEVGHDSDFWVAQEDTLVSRTSAVVGLDYSGLSETFLSVQYFVSRFGGGAVERVSLLATKDLLNDSYKLEMLVIHDLAADDGVIQFDTAYQLSSSLTVKLGADLFYGSRHADFGQFDNQDRLRLGLEFSF